jgi:hypothetical protein
MQEPAVGIRDSDRGEGLLNGVVQRLASACFATRKAVLSCDQQRSIGDSSGAYGGKYSNREPACSRASKKAAMARWEPDGCSQAREIFCRRSIE